MRIRLIPRQEHFFQLLAQAASNVNAAAKLLLDVMHQRGDLDENVRRLKKVEHAGDEVTHKIFDALNRAFVVPIDREDIAQLASALDDVVDSVEEAATRFQIYRIAKPTALAAGFARLLADQAAVIESAIPLIDGLPDRKKLRDCIVELHRLENEGDELMTQALAGIYDGAADVPSLIVATKWADVYERLEQATDHGERVGVALEAILGKNG